LPNSKISLISQAGCSIIKTLWHEPELLNYINVLVSTENFTDVHREIINYIEKCYTEGRTPDALNSARELTPAANLEISRIFGKYSLNDSEMLAFQDSVKVMRRVDLERRYKQIEREIKELSKVGDIENVNKKCLNLIEIQKEITEL
jgi:hypothetical protein